MSMANCELKVVSTSYIWCHTDNDRPVFELFHSNISFSIVNSCLICVMILINYHLPLIITIHQVCVLRLIQVVRSVEKIEKILHSQNSKESSSLEISRWETDMLTNPLAFVG